MHMKKMHLVAAAIMAMSLSMTAGCSRNKPANKDKSYIARDVETLYSLAYDTMSKGRHRQAAALFDEVERQHPYSIWARRAQTMSTFNYYAARKYSDAILAAQRFLSLHPGNKDAAYIHYIIALSYYEQIADVSRDQRITEQALSALNELIQRYPNTPYADDARLKVDLVNDHLAGKEMTIGRFYAKNRQWIAATTRFRRVIDDYQTTSHTPEALYRMTEAYLALGIPEEAKRNAAVLGANYPGSIWYERSYKLLHQHGAA